MTPPPAARRIALLDVIRTAALIGMAAYHLTYDLEMFGLIEPGTATSGFFYWHARSVASTFLGLAGLSLWLAHGQGLRWPAFWRRWAKVAGAAALVSVATFVAIPQAWVFFGILHAIALYSLLALPFLRLPWAVTALAGAFFVWGAYALPTPAMNAPLLRFVGLQTVGTMTVDIEPIFPWFGAVLLGLAIGQLGSRLGLWARLAALPCPPVLRLLGAPGRHSLAIYLIHQPLLFGLVWAWVAFLR